MKKLSTLFLTLLLTGTAFAQIPNAGFESWTHSTAGGGYDTPDSWGNTNPFTSIVSTFTCEKGTTGAPAGTSYIKLTSRDIGIAVVPGLAVTGTINPTTFTVSGGFAYTSRPASLTGQWQYMAWGSDAGHVAIFLSKWNTATSKRDTVAFTDHVLPGMVMAWTPFTINLNYYSGKFPDTAMILLSSSGTTAVDSSYLYADALAFAGSVPSGVVTVANGAVPTIIYPNPAENEANIFYYSKHGGITRVSISDVAGQTVKEISFTATRGENNFPVTVRPLAHGHYVVRISDDDGFVIRRLIVE